MALTKSLSFSLGRKRILISNNSCDLQHFCDEFECFTPLKKLCSQEFDIQHDFSSVNLNSNSVSLLEALPQELLIKVICGVDHDDLKRLFFVSKTVRDAAIIAKKCHFAYSTPSKTKAFRNSIDMLNDKNPLEDSDDLEAPNAPKQARKMNRKRLDSRKLEDISVALFADKATDAAEQRWPRRSLFMDIDS
ncbi:F-box protein SKIP27 [Silene latifolia]|uniref:F-box protein SKIP27 n=1 Tax=Silene latifolia TaxID=37657 RepID=UPI003D7802C4